MNNLQEQTIVIRRHYRSKRLSLRVRDDGSVLMSIPKYCSRREAEYFLTQHQVWIQAAQERMRHRRPTLLLQGGATEYQVYKEQARARIEPLVSQYAEYYGVAYWSISIRNQKTRFGSCSARGHLSFNYRLFFLPDALLNYVVVHEVCHLRELNHSQGFWRLLAQTIPDYRERRRQLQTYARASGQEDVRE